MTRTTRTTRTSARALAVLAVATATFAVGLAPTVAETAAPAPRPSRVPAASGPAAAGIVVDPRPDVDGTRTRTDARALRGASRIAGRPANVLALHSDRTAQRTIYLDFNGAYVSRTIWNEEGLRSGTVEPYDPAGNGAALSEHEADIVYEVWARVAEDYAPFGIDVTTAYPGKAGIERLGRADKRFGTTVVVTDDPRPMEQIATCANACGGVAWIGSFAEPDNHTYYQPAFVLMPTFEDTDAAALAAEAASHEAGHTLGLEHDDKRGDAVEGYYTGHNPWAPIMGTAYTQPVSQFSRGSYAKATNKQDDLAVIRTHGGPRRPDDVGATRSTAKPYAGRTLSGVITTPDDVDLYRLDGCAGKVTVKVAVAAYGANLDVGSALSDARLEQLSFHDDPVVRRSRHRADGLGVLYREELPAEPAAYYVSVDGIGKAGTTPTTGYDDYGSLGRYTIQVYGCGKS